MNFFTVATMRRLWAPRHELSCSRTLWTRLAADLRKRGHDATRESGAFLLGSRVSRRARIVDYVLYDDLDPNCLATGIVRFDGRFFGALWDTCDRLGLSVIADVHVHPGGVGQSQSDRDHPMISQPGHVALILPRFAAPPIRRRDIGIYRYLGAKRWDPVPEPRRASFLHIGL